MFMFKNGRVIGTTVRNTERILLGMYMMKYGDSLFDEIIEYGSDCEGYISDERLLMERGKAAVREATFAVSDEWVKENFVGCKK